MKLLPKLSKFMRPERSPSNIFSAGLKKDENIEVCHKKMSRLLKAIAWLTNGHIWITVRLTHL